MDLRNETDDPLEAYYRAPKGGGFIVNLRLDRMRTFGPLGFGCARDGGGPDWNRLIAHAKTRIARRSQRLGGQYALSRYSGPVSDAYGQLRFSNLIEVYHSIRDDGYHPVSHIRANLLVRDGKCRASISDGNHRVAALVAAGLESIPVLVAGRNKEGPAVIWQGDSASWPAVRSGLLTQEQALEVFNRIFDANAPLALLEVPRTQSMTGSQPT